MRVGWSYPLVAAFAISACSMLRGNAGVPNAEKSAGPDYGEQAELRAIGGSAVIGKVRVIDRGNAGTVLVSAINIPPGDFRIAFHETPNCSSPNGFSAGPAWAPAGKRPEDVTPTLHVNSEGRAEMEIRVPGLHAGGVEGVAGRSVVLYAGPHITQARPDVPNERIACGVFGAARPPQF